MSTFVLESPPRVRTRTVKVYVATQNQKDTLAMVIREKFIHVTGYQADPIMLDATHITTHVPAVLLLYSPDGKLPSTWSPLVQRFKLHEHVILVVPDSVNVKKCAYPSIRLSDEPVTYAATIRQMLHAAAVAETETKREVAYA